MKLTYIKSVRVLSTQNENLKWQQNVNIMELREVITVSMNRKRRVSRGLQVY